jgi:GntR family transcriptional regulator
VHVINYMPRRFAGVLPDLRDPQASLYGTITRVAGVQISRMHRTIEAATADRTLATLLEVEVGHPIVVVEAVAYGADGEPIDFSRASVCTDRLRVSVDTGFEAGGISTEHASGRYPTGRRTAPPPDRLRPEPHPA